MERRPRCTSICLCCHTDIITRCHFDLVKVFPAFCLHLARLQCNRLFYFVIHKERKCHCPVFISSLSQVWLIILHLKGNSSCLRCAERHRRIDIGIRRCGEKAMCLIRDRSSMTLLINARSVIFVNLPIRVCGVISFYISPCSVCTCLHLSEPHIALLRSRVIHCPAVFVFLEDRIVLCISILCGNAEKHVLCDLICTNSPVNAELVTASHYSGLCRRIDRYISKQFRSSRRVILRKRHIDH